MCLRGLVCRSMWRVTVSIERRLQTMVLSMATFPQAVECMPASRSSNQTSALSATQSRCCFRPSRPSGDVQHPE